MIIRRFRVLHDNGSGYAEIARESVRGTRAAPSDPRSGVRNRPVPRTLTRCAAPATRRAEPTDRMLHGFVGDPGPGVAVALLHAALYLCSVGPPKQTDP